MLSSLDYIMMIGIDEYLYRFGTGVAGIVAVVGIVIGAVQCYFGYKVFKIIMGIIGFFTGFGLGGALGAFIMAQSGGGGGIIVVLALIGGILGVIVAVKVYFIGIFLYGLALGFLIGYLLSQEIILGVILGVISGALLVVFDRLLIIISTSIFGGSGLGVGVSALFFSMGISVPSAITALLFIAFIATGVYYQFKVNGGLPSGILDLKQFRIKREKTEKVAVTQGTAVFSSRDIPPAVAFCEECGTQLERESVFCSNCGSKARG